MGRPDNGLMTIEAELRVPAATVQLVEFLFVEPICGALPAVIATRQVFELQLAGLVGHHRDERRGYLKLTGVERVLQVAVVIAAGAGLSGARCHGERRGC